MAKKPVRTPHTLNSGPKTRGEGKIRAAKGIKQAIAKNSKDPAYSESTGYGLKMEGSELLATAYERGVKVSPASAKALPADVRKRKGKKK